MEPPMDRAENPCSAPNQIPRVGFHPSTCTVDEIFTFHVNAIKCIRGAAHYNRIDVLNSYVGRFKSSLDRFRGKLFASFLSSSNEFRHTRANYRYTFLER